MYKRQADSLVADVTVDSDDEIVFNNARARPSEDEGPVNDVGDNGDRGPSHPPMSEALKNKQLELEIEKIRLEQCKLSNPAHPSALQGEASVGPVKAGTFRFQEWLKMVTR